MKVCVAVMALGVVLTPAFIIVWVDHFELYSTGWDVFLPLALLSGMVTVLALVATLVLSFQQRRAAADHERGSSGDA